MPGIQPFFLVRLAACSVAIDRRGGSWFLLLVVLERILPCPVAKGQLPCSPALISACAALAHPRLFDGSGPLLSSSLLNCVSPTAATQAPRALPAAKGSAFMPAGRPAE
jgi:hypothetical protein